MSNRIRTFALLLLLVLPSCDSGEPPPPVASGEPPPPVASGEPPPAAEVLARAREAMGGGALDRLESMSAAADCTGPMGPFVTEVHSAAGGRVIFRQTQPSGESTTQGVAGEVGWVQSPEGDYQLLDSAAQGYVRAHEFHLQVIEAEERFSDPRTVGFGELAGHPSVEVAFTGEAGVAVSIFYRRDNHLPAGMVLQPPGEAPAITVIYDDWRTVDGVTLFGSFELTNGEFVFTYDYNRIELNAVDEALFEVPAEVEALVRAAATSSGEGDPGG